MRQKRAALHQGAPLAHSGVAPPHQGVSGGGFASFWRRGSPGLWFHGHGQEALKGAQDGLKLHGRACGACTPTPTGNGAARSKRRKHPMVKEKGRMTCNFELHSPSGMVLTLPKRGALHQSRKRGRSCTFQGNFCRPCSGFLRAPPLAHRLVLKRHAWKDPGPTSLCHVSLNTRRSFLLNPHHVQKTANSQLRSGGSPGCLHTRRRCSLNVREIPLTGTPLETGIASA